MKRLAILIGAVAALGTLAAARPQSLTERNRAIVTDFARLFYTERNVPAAFGTYVVEDYIQHNPGIADGRAAAVAALTPKFSTPGARFDIKRILVDGDYAMIHVHARLTPQARGGAVADIYRMKDGKIVEHWDVLQPVPEASAHPHPMF